MSAWQVHGKARLAIDATKAVGNTALRLGATEVDVMPTCRALLLRTECWE